MKLLKHVIWTNSANLNSPKSKLSGGGDTIPPIKVSKNNFIKYIKTFLTGRKARIKNYKESATLFDILNGAPQGDSPSAYLFIMVMQLLLFKIEYSGKIQKAKIGLNRNVLNRDILTNKLNAQETHLLNGKKKRDKTVNVKLRASTKKHKNKEKT
mgnify:CR=1 FL=1